MAKIDFPSPATQGETYTQNSLSWVYNGEAWDPTPADASIIDNTAYGISWDGSVATAPSQNAVYDKIETIGGSAADDTAYGVSWNGSTDAATKNAIYDKIETIGGSAADNTAYGVSWNGDTTTAPSKNAVYDKIETIGAGGGGTVQGTFQTNDLQPVLVSGAASTAAGQGSVDFQMYRVLASESASGSYSTIGGGFGNTAAGFYNTVSGGYRNKSEGNSSSTTISGGGTNTITGNSFYSTIGGGFTNVITNSNYGLIAGGQQHAITNSSSSSILGGSDNEIIPSFTKTGNVITGGTGNEIQADRSFIGAGQNNLLTIGSRSAIVSGSGNSMSGYGGTDSCIAAGSSNTISGYGCFIGGGSNCDVDGFFGGSTNTTVLGGSTNSAYYASNSVVLGGRDCSLYYSDYTVMSGRRAKITVANKHGQFIYADDQDLDYLCNTERTANFRVANGMHITAPLFIDERASALADIAGRGQIWVKTATPNELWFTDDAGSDRPISEGVYTVAALPAGVAGRRAFVTDSNNALSNHHGQTVSAGGANFVPVFHDGSNWIVG